MRKNLIHIGYAKAGSTFLKKWFSVHPQLQYEESGIGGFTDVYRIIDWSARNIENLPKYYVTSGESLGAGWTNHYGSLVLAIKKGNYNTENKVVETQTKVCHTLFEIFPKSKIVIITRGFESALLSSYSEFIKAGGDLILSEYLKMLDQVLLQWLDIDFIYTIYAETFGEENIIMLPFELLKESQDDFIRLLEGKLEIDHVEIDFGVQNPSFTQVEMILYRKIARSFLLPLDNILPQKIMGYIYSRYSSHVVRPNRLKKIVLWLDKLFKPTIEGLEIPDEYLMQFINNASCLLKFPLYEKYLSEYLIK